MCQLSYHKSKPIPISLCFLVAIFIWLFLPHLVPGCPRRLVAKGPEAKLQQGFQLQHGFLHTDEVSHLGDGYGIGLMATGKHTTSCGKSHGKSPYFDKINNQLAMLNFIVDSPIKDCDFL